MRGSRRDGGTITAISGTTLTLRTENGTETVDTSSTTTYRKEMQTISFSDLRINDMVRVAAVPAPTSSSGAANPAEPGTGTVNAKAVTVIEPTFAGRVASISNGTYNLVGRDGEMLTVTTTSLTRYGKGMSKVSPSAISVGSHVIAEGVRTDLTHLRADLVDLRPTRALSPTGPRIPPPPSGSPGQSLQGA